MFEIKIIKNHDEAYELWKKRGIQNATIFHIDTHADFTSFSDCYYITIGNYLNYAWNEGIANCVIWIIPSFTFNDSERMNLILNQTSDFREKVVLDEQIELILKRDNAKRLILAPITQVEKLASEIIDSPLLVDIDVDFFMNPDSGIVYSYFFRNSFWMDLDSFSETILRIKKKCTLITISDSLVGGYTPAIFSYISSYLYTSITGSDNQFLMIDRAVKTLIKKEYCHAVKCFHTELDKGNSTLSCLLGLVYGYVGLDDFVMARKYYIMVLKRFKHYEPYFFPVYGLLKEQRYEEAEHLIDIWLELDENSQQAILYRIKIHIYYNCSNDKQIEKLLLKITDETTQFEKSYICIRYYYMKGYYDKAIRCCRKILNYFCRNETPYWVGQISSFEKRKNHGIILANTYYLLSRIYFNLGEYKQASYNEKISKKLGLNDGTTNKIFGDLT